ncbi:aldo/keto reductase [Nannocystis radixulma]|uniref:Aldo/keto reductase n=1 Tax=Nannocystis radixulma TaxID=2995305 RepID=A0ABT5BNH8_9BACT|nr:aldo/keto reductase [Nannocystis radixulma]MDC0675130.1 aldo/keto reductase [Nannocystis radixulma]
MRYRTFGRRSGLRVSQLALGTGNFGTRWGHGAEPAEARRIFDAYAEAGGNFIDTADTYQVGQSEELLGEFLANERDRFVVASKYTLGTTGGLSHTGNSRKAMIQSLEASLRRLKTDRLELYWVHFPDDLTPIDEIVRGLDDLARAGKILYGGLSNFPAWRVARADAIAELRGWTPLAGIQIEHSLVERTGERELLPMAEALGLGAALWSPLGGGFLTGKYRTSDEGRLTGLGMLVHTEKTARETAILDAVVAVAAEAGVAPIQVALAWSLARGAASTTALVPILGPRTREQLDAALAALELTLSPAQLARLDDASAISLGTPHQQVLASRARIAGGQLERLDRPVIPVA